MRVVLHVDGGARGNPGPAAVGIVIAAPDGTVLDEHGETIGVATSNVAEYRALLVGLARARALGADEIEVYGDSALVVNQVKGAWKVKQPHLRPLREEAAAALATFARRSIGHVPRARNAAADALVNQALDADAR